MSDQNTPRPTSRAQPSTAQIGSAPLGPAGDLQGLNPRELKIAIQKMNTGQKKLLVMKGNPAIRKILLRDPNSDVQLAVVNSPKATESEVAQLAAMAATAEVVLKSIAESARWRRSYRIKQALANNPKTPVGIATRCLRSLATHDLKKISKDPHLRKPLVQAAERLLKTRK